MKQVILITGASSGFGELAAKALAQAGHIVYASMRETAGRNAVKVSELADFAEANKVELRALELDVSSQDSADKAIGTIVLEQGRLDVVIHNAGHLTFGPLEAYTPEQIASEYDINVVSTQRVNRVALPVMRKQRSRLVDLELQQQRGRRNAAILRALLCRQSRHGRPCGGLCKGTDALGH